MNGPTRTLVLSLICAIGGCTSGSGAILQTFRNIVPSGASDLPTQLNPQFRYLRVSVAGQVSLLALGYIDDDPAGPVEVWYSAKKEVLRLQDGRVVGLTGVGTEWRNVIAPRLPSWEALARTGEGFRWTRLRDVMPGYRYGVRDELQVRTISPPDSSSLAGMDPKQLSWFEERREAGKAAGLAGLFAAGADPDLSLPPARYALRLNAGAAAVVYGEQCLSRDLCIAWQHWPVTPR